MQTEKIALWKDPSIGKAMVRHVREDRDVRPAILVIPGGGYGCVCEESEGTPIADRFDQLGFRTFVLDYRVAPHAFPEPLLDAQRAMRLLRGHAAEWGIDPDAIAVCGFSAGAHLACALGTISDSVRAEDGDACDAADPTPNAMILCYPVITAHERTADGRPFGHLGSARNFFGSKALSPEQIALFSLEEHVGEHTPPAFLWTTPEDSCVPMTNSLAFLDAMNARSRPCELHVFPHGPHGMQLGYGRADIAQWPGQAKAFLRDTCGFQMAEDPRPGTVVLTFDDAVRNHLDTVAPLLRELGFGATFFPTRFDDAWRKEHGGILLSAADLRVLHDQGFEIGNHTWSHCGDMDKRTDAEAAAEIDRLTAFLAEAGIPAPDVYAYPGGPHSDKGEALVRARGYRGARIVDPRPWRPAEDNPFAIPACCLRNDSDWDFDRVLEAARPRDIPVFVFHGVPDLVHPWVNTDPAQFEKFLRFLHGRKYRVIGLSQALRERSVR